MTIKHLIRILLPDHVGFMKEITPLTRYINQNTTFITLMMMMCTSGYTNAIDILTFDIEEIDETGKLKLASYYLDGIVIYWHQKFIKSKRLQVVTWGEYVESICCRFGGKKDPL